MSAAVALEDGGGAVALGGVLERQLKIAAVALGRGGSRRTCDDGIGVNAVKAKGLPLQRWHQHWQGRQERTRPMQGTYVGSNGEEIGYCSGSDGGSGADTTIALMRQGQGDDGT
jgi:hypothetical protein